MLYTVVINSYQLHQFFGLMRCETLKNHFRKMLLLHTVILMLSRKQLFRPNAVQSVLTFGWLPMFLKWEICLVQYQENPDSSQC